jgi:3-hydroxybutyryl-CoA dehydrogenase
MSNVPEWPAKAAVAGAGRMGGGIAEAFATAGVAVTIADADPAQGRAALERLKRRVAGHVEAGLLPADAEERVATVELVDTPAEAAAGADLVVEAVTEDYGVKEAVLGEVSAAAPPPAVIASNTSSLDIERLAGFVARPERFLGAHWFNPPEWTPAVELIPAAATDHAHVEQLRGFLAAIGKAPAEVRPAVGFVANRLQMALFAEAIRCLDEGLASAAEIDEIARSSFGFRLPFFGPFQIADMAGLDVYRAVLESHVDAYGDRFDVRAAFANHIDPERTGTSGGTGFYDYGEPGGGDLDTQRDVRYAALAKLLEERPPLHFEEAQ